MSCSLDSEGPGSFYTEFMPITNVSVPDVFTNGESYDIFVSYNRPSDCYVFNNVVYQTSLNERTVAVINTVYTDRDCIGANEEIEVSFNIFVNSLETYVFKFYQGENENGQDLYHIVEVPVVEPQD